MKFLKKNYGWLIVSALATLPFIPLAKMALENGAGSIDMLYHISGEFAIRWMTAVLTLTPVFILFGVTNLFVRQAMGIATAVWSLLHFVIFIIAEGFAETFTQFNYVLGFIAVLILIPLLFTSNRKAMQRLKANWKKLQSFAYLAILLSLAHVAILEKTWIIYAVIVGLGFIIRIPEVKTSILKYRQQKK
ncbi:ferric reductase-like transmembrane domain-containing protein [Owenweeksia hongkongensis]|uniref:ferric reductase-like transmembrane domain-containing protein n=1 Tax=Owenweeksia hongkongensis TaxID=253245 RepID=UPI003A930AE2